MTPTSAKTQISIVEASIADLTTALTTNRITAVDLATAYLLRIARYDTRNTSLNSIPLINPDVLAEAAASDARRAAGKSGPLEGIPFTVKDSYKVRDMTVASGSEAFEDLIANEDAFTVRALRDAGAVLIGKTNMCPMAFGGMLRGVYGRAESSYNDEYLAAAFASGSSNGSGVATGASFAAFGMGEETVSSGRSPASNNALVAYTPSRGVISIRGNWPLYPTCDVVVPHTRSMSDLLAILGPLTKEDETTVGDFWRDQPFIDLKPHWQRAAKSLTHIQPAQPLKGKRIAIPAMYVNQPCEGTAVYTSPATLSLFSTATTDLEALGATVAIVSDFPVMRLYEDPSSTWPASYPSDARLPEDWNSTERGRLIAYSWDDFLRTNRDHTCPNLPSITDYRKIFPQLPLSDPQMCFSEVANAVHWAKLADHVASNTTPTTTASSQIYQTPNLAEALHALETMRKHLFEDWLTTHNYDYVAFPAAGDVGFADSDIDMESARHTWKNGVKYSNGNRCLRHLGIPSITLPMGILEDRDMPMGITFLARAYQDRELLEVGVEFERSREKRRVAPGRTPVLETDVLGGRGEMDFGVTPPEVRVDECTARKVGEETEVSLAGVVVSSTDKAEGALEVEVYIDGTKMPDEALRFSASGETDGMGVNGDAPNNGIARAFTARYTVSSIPEQDARNSVVGKIARDSIMVILSAINGNGRPAGALRMIHKSEVEG